jgi:3-deoxy-D-manno-octulosonic-acid transferase
MIEGFMFLYNLCLRFLFFLFLPLLFIIFRKNQFYQRIKIKELDIDNTIWIHASSVGEVNAVKPLVNRLIEQNPRMNFLMTCMTKTGFDTAKKLNNKLVVYPFPYDLKSIMKRAFKIFKPKMIILVETEIWPNMISIAHKKKVPVVIVNGRISDKSFPRYRLSRLFWKIIYKKISLVNAQSEIDAERFRYFGCQNVQNANNLKFSVKLPKYDGAELRKAWRFAFNDFVIAVGSSRPGEEKLIRDVCENIKNTIPRLKVIIVPRHIYRIDEVISLFNREEYSLFSEGYQDRMYTIVDEMGILPQVYAFSDIAVIGGSFLNFGGHNPIEAAIYQKPVIIGPFHYSCFDIVKKFQKNSGIMISNSHKLAEDILFLAENIERRISIGNNAYQVIEDNKNSLDIHFQNIQDLINLRMTG